MAYYFVSLSPHSFEAFKTHHKVLRSGIFISNKQNLEQTLPSVSEISFFFLYLSEDKKFLDEAISKIRENAFAKIVYLVEEKTSLDLKKHQTTPLGGDAYIFQNVNEATLQNILDGFLPPDIGHLGNKLESGTESVEASELLQLEKMKNNPLSKDMDQVFESVLEKLHKKPTWQSTENLNSAPEEDIGSVMSVKENGEIELGDLQEIELGDEVALEANQVASEDQDGGLELSLDDAIDINLEESAEAQEPPTKEEGVSLDMGEAGDLDLDLFGGADPEPVEEENLGALELENLEMSDVASDASSTGLELDLSADADDDNLDLSDDAKEKLKEIDALMDLDSPQVNLEVSQNNQSDDLNLSLAMDEQAEQVDLGPVHDPSSSLEVTPKPEDMNLDNLNFAAEEKGEITGATMVMKSPAANSNAQDLNKDFKEISLAYSGEMERTQATISNLRADREELLAKIQKLEEDKMLQNRQVLSLRAELDEKKIELSIIRKKNNEEINDLKDRMKLFDEKRLILEEKNKILQQELDKASQRNKLDLKKIQLNEKELEQRLELLKADAETQIRNRDLKILELKRKVDAMEFDMESISTQEKRSVESRYELEDKLEKAIKTLRNAITVLEDDSDKGNALDVLKKNIDM